MSGVNESFALSITTAAEGVLPHEIPNHSKLVVALAWSKALSAPSSSQIKSVEMMRAPIAYGMPYVTLEFATAASKTEITEPLVMASPRSSTIICLWLQPPRVSELRPWWMVSWHRVEISAQALLYGLWKRRSKYISRSRTIHGSCSSTSLCD